MEARRELERAFAEWNDACEKRRLVLYGKTPVPISERREVIARLNQRCRELEDRYRRAKIAVLQLLAEERGTEWRAQIRLEKHTRREAVAGDISQ